MKINNINLKEALKQRIRINNLVGDNTRIVMVDFKYLDEVKSYITKL